MSNVDQNLIAELLDAARTAGADGADAALARSEGTSVSVRLGKVESSERCLSCQQESCALFTMQNYILLILYGKIFCLTSAI